jgi:hypothetical protein
MRRRAAADEHRVTVDDASEGVVIAQQIPRVAVAQELASQAPANWFIVDEQLVVSEHQLVPQRLKPRAKCFFEASVALGSRRSAPARTSLRVLGDKAFQLFSGQRVASAVVVDVSTTASMWPIGHSQMIARLADGFCHRRHGDRAVWPAPLIDDLLRRFHDRVVESAPAVEPVPGELDHRDVRCVSHGV